MSRIRLPIVALVTLVAGAWASRATGDVPARAWAQREPLQPNPTLTICYVFCDSLKGRVPAADIEVAFTSPDRPAGSRQACNPNLDIGPNNPLRVYLSLRNPNAPYHPLGNNLVWKCGCP